MRNAIRPRRWSWCRHQRAGDVVVIVTATNAFVTRPIAQAFGVEDLIAVELERDETHGGWYTGAIAGVPSFARRQSHAWNEWLAQRGWGWASVHVTFYSDSMNDLPLLERVHDAGRHQSRRKVACFGA